uniref:C-type lectin domain-containing protein n=1 Tax=Xiphophorus couchianus TaxID=32473 RepID=A0A3B5M1F2_9TELE
MSPRATSASFCIIICSLVAIVTKCLTPPFWITVLTTSYNPKTEVRSIAVKYPRPISSVFLAQSYCRTHHTDLAMIENEAENSAVKQLIPVGVNVWIGLYRVPWSWSDKRPSLFRRWVSPEPDNYGGIQNCVCENTAHMWGDEKCSATKAVCFCLNVVVPTVTSF